MDESIMPFVPRRTTTSALISMEQAKAMERGSSFGLAKGLPIKNSHFTSREATK